MKFEKPVMEVTFFDTEDIITSSGGKQVIQDLKTENSGLSLGGKSGADVKNIISIDVVP